VLSALQVYSLVIGMLAAVIISAGDDIAAYLKRKSDKIEGKD
jgi:hypothetical protein